MVENRVTHKKLNCFFVAHFKYYVNYYVILKSIVLFECSNICFVVFIRNDQITIIHSLRASEVVVVFCAEWERGNSLVPNLHSYGLVAGELMNLIALPFSWKWSSCTKCTSQNTGADTQCL